MSIEDVFYAIENGNKTEKLHAISILSELVQCEVDLDIKRIMKFLLHIYDSEIFSKIFILLSYMAMQRTVYKKKLSLTTDLYHLAKQTFVSGSINKVISVLNFLTTLVHTDEDESNDIHGADFAKKAIRAAGCLGEMCQLFLKSSLTSMIWQPLCLCLSECCIGIVQNQAYSSHIIPKCIQNLNECFKSEIVMLIQSLIQNHSENQEKFVQLGGIQCIVRCLMETWEGLQLLSIAITDCTPAIDIANKYNITERLTFIQSKTKRESKISKWCTIILWKLQSSGKMENDNHFIHQEENSKIIDHDPLNISKSVMTAKLIGTKITPEHSFISKFDAVTLFPGIQKKPSFSNTILKGCNDNSFIKKRQSPYRRFKKSYTNNNKENIFYGRTAQSKNRNVFFKENSIDLECKEFLNKIGKGFNIESPYQSNTSRYTSSFEFSPKITSTPIHDNDTSHQESYGRNINSIISGKLKKKGNGYFKAKNRITCNNSHNNGIKVSQIDKNDNISGPMGSRFLFNKNYDDSNKHDILTTTFKVRSLVKDILDYHQNIKTKQTNGEKDVAYFLTPNKTNNEINRSLSHIRNSNDDKKEPIFKVLLHDDTNTRFSPINSNVNVNQSKSQLFSQHMAINSSTLSTNLVKESPINECASCKRLSHESISSNTNNLRIIIKRLKIGIALYGCDFQKMSETLWSSNDNISPVILYEIFLKHIVKK